MYLKYKRVVPFILPIFCPILYSFYHIHTVFIKFPIFCDNLSILYDGVLAESRFAYLKLPDFFHF